MSDRRPQPKGARVANPVVTPCAPRADTWRSGLGEPIIRSGTGTCRPQRQVLINQEAGTPEAPRQLRAWASIQRQEQEPKAAAASLTSRGFETSPYAHPAITCAQLYMPHVVTGRIPHPDSRRLTRPTWGRWPAPIQPRAPAAARPSRTSSTSSAVRQRGPWAARVRGLLLLGD